MASRLQRCAKGVWADPEKRWLSLILVIGALLRLGMAFYLGNQVGIIRSAFDQIFYQDLALNLLAGKGFVFTLSPWPFIEPGAPTAYYSFLYPRFLAGIYSIFGPQALAARVIQALICSLMPLQVYGLVRRILRQRPAWQERARTVALVAAAIAAGYAYFVFYSATLMTEGLYLMTVVWSLSATLDLAEESSPGRWASWALAVTLASLLRQVYMLMAGLLFLYVLWKARGRVRVRDVALAAGIAAVLILPWTVRNYMVFDRFLLLNSQAGQVFWNANHPKLGVKFEGSPMFPIPADLQGANEVDLGNELLLRALENVAQDPWRFVRLTLNKTVAHFRFWPVPSSSLFNNIARTLSFTICLPFMIGGLVLSLREWRRWQLLYVFIAVYTFIHVITWPGPRYRLAVDVVLVAFAALSVVDLVVRWQHYRGRAAPVVTEG